MSFINFSNHPSAQWGTEQFKKAREFGEVIDLAFPSVSPEADENEIARLAEAFAGKIIGMAPAAVMIQGEFTLAFAVVLRLKQKGIKCLAACSNRLVEEEDNVKLVRFDFVRFREYLL